MKASDYIASVLQQQRVAAVFELVGGMITHMIDSVFVQGEVPIVSMHHEQGAAFAAEAVGKITGIPGVAMATSGPGATNLLTGVGSCYFDSSPAVFITGQVNRHEQKGNRAVRQLGFQETDIVSMARPVTKHSVLVQDVRDLPNTLHGAFRLATDKRPGPVLIDIPMDVQRENVEPEWLMHHAADAPLLPEERDLVALKEALLKAQRPLVLAGGGVRAGRVTAEFRQMVEMLSIPVVHSLMGVDALPWSHTLNAGMIGSYGNRWSNLAISQCDLLVVVGSRLDVRQTGADTQGFKEGRQIFHLDCDAGEMNNRVTGCHAILGELRPALLALHEMLLPIRDTVAANCMHWLGEIAALRRRWPDTQEIPDLQGINPNSFMHGLSQAGASAGAYVVDVGQHQMWAAQSLEIADDQRFLTSGGMGSMGFALPAGIGAAIALAGQPVVVIAGDGGFQCNIQELQTVARLGLPIKIVVVNNNCLGMVRQFQESYFKGRYRSTLWGYTAPDFEAVAKAYGIPSKSISDPTQIASASEWLFADHQSPALLQVMVSPNANAYPKLAFGKGMTSMEPQEKPIAMEGT
ncbi:MULTISPECIES: thiamine pyrophosphate-binding protein [Acidobacterium]|uniref:Acetolactate synthase, large subunit n=1 Tax=Acidobacterium capsulatum (strain ATCC 51196 / DSM 11244 / BCRC 80197 / JCM 7670 / NBRC 15755 / NCIMB 13165 / 161) TaxID=240015 RepID=C1F1H7_ACIC5|nr:MULTISPECIES: thiamine pyrophosphate-binding protein [Acidobacterium]ACO34678.1 acetolactate synthase, large subunit [Acidobacterium capsulatum ATCC 51196]HCT61898.1 thiamine pyrophosphate-binding protein [Acidobacterium sp.]